MKAYLIMSAIFFLIAGVMAIWYSKEVADLSERRLTFFYGLLFVLMAMWGAIMTTILYLSP